MYVCLVIFTIQSKLRASLTVRGETCLNFAVALQRAVQYDMHSRNGCATWHPAVEG